MKNVEKPLVSCTVLTYNSGKTVRETLDSIKNQTYWNIELIISDDCSIDDTVLICKDWLEQNHERFVRTQILTVDKNTGVCDNANRSFKACSGIWHKGIAGDDILLPNCISDFIEFVDNNPSAKWVSSYMRIYKENFKEENCISSKSVSSLSFFEMTAEKQLQKMVLWNRIAAPTIFYSLSLIKEIGEFDNSYLFEDYPYFVRILEKGYKCYFLEKETVGYRLHNSSSHSKGKLFDYAFILKSKKFHKDYCFKYLTLWQRLGQYSIWGLQYSFEKLNMNKDTRFLRSIYKNLHSLLRKIFNN